MDQRLQPGYGSLHNSDHNRCFGVACRARDWSRRAAVTTRHSAADDLLSSMNFRVLRSIQHQAALSFNRGARCCLQKTTSSSSTCERPNGLLMVESNVAAIRALLARHRSIRTNRRRCRRRADVENLSLQLTPASNDRQPPTSKLKIKKIIRERDPVSPHRVAYSLTIRSRCKLLSHKA